MLYTNKVLALPKDVLDYVAKNMSSIAKKDYAGKTYVPVAEVDINDIRNFTESLFNNDPEKFKDIIHDIVQNCSEIWSIPPLGYYGPILSTCLDCAKENNDDLTLLHYILLCSNYEGFRFVAFKIGQFEKNFTCEELIIDVLDNQEHGMLKSADVLGMLETIYMLGLLNKDEDEKYTVKSVDADPELVKLFFNIISASYEEFHGVIASNILKPFMINN